MGRYYQSYYGPVNTYRLPLTLTDYESKIIVAGAASQTFLASMILVKRTWKYEVDLNE